jgi:pyruvate formate-lyase/glycerol dehydratase family glycyl radical enzyme
MDCSPDRVTRLKARYMATVPRLDSERAVIVTKSYQETEAEPIVMRRAKALKRILEEMTVLIADDELIVGNQGSTYRGASLFPEFGIEWLYKEWESGDWEKRKTVDEVFLLEDEDKKAILGIREYWKGKSLSERMAAMTPDGTEHIAESGVITLSYPDCAWSSVGHFNANYGTVLEKGLLGIKHEAEEHLKQMGSRINGTDIERYHTWKAIAVVCEAAADFGKRYAALAKQLAEREKDPQRKAELLRIADACFQVPGGPARTFYEAVQSFWFLHLLMHIDANHPGVSPGRFDQYMYPYYRKDVEEGRLTRSEAQELIECLWIKLSEINKIKEAPKALASGGYSSGQNLLLGGQTKEGRDATNDLSYICCDAQASVRTHEPSLAVRLWNGSPDELWNKAIDTTKVIGGLPCFFNDEVIVPQMINNGYSLEDALDYCIIGCVEPAGSGNAFPCTAGSGNGSYFNLPLALYYGINNGIDHRNGKQYGLATGYLADFQSFDEVKEAYRKQIQFFVDWHITVTNVWELVSREMMPFPLLSAVIDGCVESGRDVTAGGAKYNCSGITGVGTANIGDALATIKKLIFDDKKYTGAELLEAIRTNWEGREALRSEILTTVPKYGNDEPYVDELSRWATTTFAESIQGGVSPRGQYSAGLWPMTLHVIMGMASPATLDGRKDREPFADGISPRQGMDKNGPTAVLNSCGRLHQRNLMNGTLLNMRFHPNAVKGREGTERLRDLIQTYFDVKGMHVQFNVLSTDTLRDAQRNPDKYKDLVVRVAGYSAFFVELNTAIQNDIIARTENAA